MPARTTRGKTGIGRPPKKWWDGCVRGVKRRSGKHGVRSPEQVCGALWFQKMGQSGRREAVARETGRKSGRKTGRRTTASRSGRCRTRTGRFTRC
jgi:hypothetical protein